MFLSESAVIVSSLMIVVECTREIIVTTLDGTAHETQQYPPFIPLALRTLRCVALNINDLRDSIPFSCHYI